MATEYRVVKGSDDAEERGGTNAVLNTQASNRLASNSSAFGQYYHFARFEGMNVTPGIEMPRSAELWLATTAAQRIYSDAHCEYADNCSSSVIATGNLSVRPRTVQSHELDQVTPGGNAHRIFDITRAVQELYNRPTWNGQSIGTITVPRTDVNVSSNVLSYLNSSVTGPRLIIGDPFVSPWTFHAASSGRSIGGSSANTDPIDSTGSDLMVCVVSSFGLPSGLTDNQGNTWVQGGTFDQGGYTVTYFYCVNPVTSVSHIVSYSGATVYPALHLIAVSGADTANPIDAGQGYAGNVAGPFTAGVSDALYITGVVTDKPTHEVDDYRFWRHSDTVYAAGAAMGGASCSSRMIGAPEPLTLQLASAGGTVGSAIVSFRPSTGPPAPVAAGHLTLLGVG